MKKVLMSLFTIKFIVFLTGCEGNQSNNNNMTINNSAEHKKNAEAIIELDADIFEKLQADVDMVQEAFSDIPKEEKIIEENPNLIFYAKDLRDMETNDPLESVIKMREGWGKIAAIEKGRVVPVEENLVTRIGPRVTGALKQITEAIYPEKYANEA